jgi:VanZ family protein
MKKYLPNLLFIGLGLEILVLLLSYLEANGNLTHFFQASARLSGRVSLLYFGFLFVYSTLNPFIESNSEPLQVKYILARNFAILHIIHWFLLATAVSMSGFNIVPYKLMGGALAYLMIVLLPFILSGKLFPNLSLRLALNIYLPYVWLIFFITYLTRVLGKATPITGIMPAYYSLISITLGLMIWRVGILWKNRAL